MQDEDADNRTERTHGDVTGRKRYSHVDLIHMIGGMDAERGTVTAGGRGYYLMVSCIYIHNTIKNWDRAKNDRTSCLDTQPAHSTGTGTMYAHWTKMPYCN